MTTTQKNAVALLGCAFCGGAARIESNRDWHRLYADHDEDCVLDADEADLMFPATPAHLADMIAIWNRRAATPSPEAPAGEAVRYEKRMRAPNGNVGAWHVTDAEMHARYGANPDIGDGFTYEVRALFAAPVERNAQPKFAERDILLAGIQAICVGASQEYTRCKGAIPQWDSGFFAGQMHVFDMYTNADKTAIAEANEYLRKISDTAPAPEAPPTFKAREPADQAGARPEVKTAETRMDASFDGGAGRSSATVKGE